MYQKVVYIAHIQQDRSCTQTKLGVGLTLSLVTESAWIISTNFLITPTWYDLSILRERSHQHGKASTP